MNHIFFYLLAKFYSILPCFKLYFELEPNSISSTVIFLYFKSKSYIKSSQNYRSLYKLFLKSLTILSIKCKKNKK